MRIGIAIELHGPSPGDTEDPTRWHIVRESAAAAEEAGFDVVVAEDVLLGERDDHPTGAWESVAMLGAIAAATDSVSIGHSMVNAPYRAPALVASIANTLDEISSGRYILGLGAGNTSDADYAAIGAPADRRFSRFAEGVEIIYSMLRGERVDRAGRFRPVSGAELLVRGPRPAGPPIVIGARGPKMMRLAAEYADEWNANAYVPQTVDAFRPFVTELEAACEEVGRDPATLRRSIDLAVHAPDIAGGARPSDLAQYLVHGTREEVAAQVLAFGGLGIEEARCYLSPPLPPERRPDAIRSMADIVQLVHAG